MSYFTVSLSELLSNSHISAMEAKSEPIEIISKVEDPDVSMAIALITDDIIMNSNLKPVTDPIAHSAGGIPTDGGLFSDIIFGRDPESRQRQFAYIDLHEKFFHPYVYEILKALMPKRFEKCAHGSGTSWKITNDGELVEVKKGDADYNEDNSGIAWLIKNYHKLKFSETGSMIRGDRIKLLKSLSDNEIFITKWIVVPIVYRDIDKNSSIHKLPELNTHYNKIIQYANSLKDATFDFFNNQIRYNLQQELIVIRKYGQSLIEKKHGFFHKAILGKSIDRGSRDVISVPTMTNLQRPEDNPIDIFHSGIPLAKCLILGYDFVLRYCIQFFADNFRNVTEYPVHKLVNGEYKIVGSVKIKNQVEKFSSDYIKKKINRFKNSYGTRFEYIMIETEDGQEIPMHLSGQFAPMSEAKPMTSTIINRPMTWTDLFYLAAENTLSDKYVYITRFPVTSHSSIFPSQCRVLSTIKTIPAYIDGQFYKYYPYIDLNTPKDRISSVFNDTVTMSNMYLAALGGDYDGDQTAQKLCFSIEANAEAKEIAESVRNFVSPEGKLLRTLGNEAYLTFYNMTRDKPSGGILSNELKKELLALKSKELTINKIADLFGKTTSMNSKDKKSVFDVKEPKFNPQAKFTLQAGEYINKETITTTVGIFLFNKLLIEGLLEDVVPGGYYNEICNKKNFSKLTDMVASAIMSQKIQIKPTLVDFLNANEFWGLGLVAIFGTSYSMETIVPNKQLEAKKAELLKNAPDNDLATLSKIEQELIKEADRLTEGTPGKFLFDSGARGSFSNDFKNMAISIGPVENPITGEFDFMSSNYMQGIKKEDIPAAANSILNAEYPKAIGTAKGGYMGKIMYSVFQTMGIDEDGTDCGTNNGLMVTLTKDNIRDYYDQYIMDGKNLILIDADLPVKYMNHPVMLRSPMYCISDKLCSKCAGKRFYKVGITDIGLTVPAMTGSLMNAQLKRRHSMEVKMHYINENELLI